MSKKLTNDEFLQKLKERNSNVTPLEEYKSAWVKIQFKCNLCNDIFKSTPTNICMIRSCKKCYEKDKFKFQNHEEFIKFSKNLFGDQFIYLSSFKTLKEPIKFKCVICEKTIDQRTDQHLKRGCRSCIKSKQIQGQTLTNEQFLERLKKVHGDRFVPLDTYVKSYIKMKYLCTLCNNINYSKPNSLLESKGCIYCSMSMGENRIRCILNDYKIEYIQEHIFPDCKSIRHLEFDFYIPSLNLCIEYQGPQHYRIFKFNACSQEQAEKSFEITKRNDLIKKNYCAENGIKLIEIKYTQFKGIEYILKQNGIIPDCKSLPKDGSF